MFETEFLPATNKPRRKPFSKLFNSPRSTQPGHISETFPEIGRENQAAKTIWPFQALEQGRFKSWGASGVINSREETPSARLSLRIRAEESELYRAEHRPSGRNVVLMSERLPR